MAKQIAQIAKSIQIFGFNVPVLINADSQVIAGHGRLQACELLGITEVPVIRLKHLSKHQQKAFLIADNRLTENAEWDNRLLGEQLKILAEAEINFSIESTGFEMAEIDLLIEGLAPDYSGESDPVDEVPEDDNLPQVTRVDDLWFLGKRRVLCANALDPKSFSKLMLGRKANVIFTDPPFNVKIDGNVSGKGQTHHRESAMASGEMSIGEFTDFLTKAFHLLADNSVDGSIHFVCMDWRHIKELVAAGEEAYGELKNLCVWMKR